jgi:hypothetical protein
MFFPRPTLAESTLHPQIKSWSDKPVSPLKLLPPTVATYLGSDLELVSHEYLEEVTIMLSELKASWTFRTPFNADELTPALIDWRTDKSELTFTCEYELQNGTLSEIQPSTNTLDILFDDMDIFEWNCSPHSHRICLDKLTALLKVPVKNLSITNLSVLYAIIYRRLVNAGAQPLAAYPTVVLPNWEKLPGLYPAPSVPMLFHKTLGSTPRLPQVRRTMLSVILNELVKDGFNPHKQGVDPSGWRCLSKRPVVNGVVLEYRHFDQLLVTAVQTKDFTLFVKTIKGLVHTPSPEDLSAPNICLDVRDFV